MTAQVCPRCQKRGLTWSLDEEQSPLTAWFCSYCRYTALEDESKERMCEHCGVRSASALQDESETYLYCFSCGQRGNASLQ